jgi:hypothetical protein
VRFVPPPCPLDLDPRAVDREQPAPDEPLADKGRRYARTAADLQDAVAALHAKLLDRQANTLRNLRGHDVVPIGVPGFEPGTSPTRTARATRLRYTPNGQ